MQSEVIYLAYVYENKNPANRRVGDCVIRAIAKVMNMSWDDVAIDLSMMMVTEKDILTSNAVWGKYLRLNGFERYSIENTCPDCYSVRDFCLDNPVGIFVLGTGSHAIAVINGDYYDSWDCGDEIPLYAWGLKN